MIQFDSYFSNGLVQPPIFPSGDGEVFTFSKANLRPTADGCTAELLETWMFRKIVGFPPKSSIFNIINHPFIVYTRWWQLKYSCSSLFGEDEPNLTFAYFPDGWVETTKQIYTEESTRSFSDWLLPLMNLKPHGHNRLSRRLVPIRLSSFRTVAVLPGGVHPRSLR